METEKIALKNVNYEKGSLLDYCNILPVDGIAKAEAEKPSKVQLTSANIVADGVSLPPEEMTQEVDDVPEQDDAVVQEPSRRSTEDDEE